MISSWYMGIKIMFKFNVVSLAGNTYVTAREESKIRESIAAQAPNADYSITPIQIPASWLLMIHFGWQGGTIHQVAAETGLSVNDILTLDSVVANPSKLDGMSDYYMGYHIGHITPDLSLVDKVQYWRGVCEHVKQYRTDKIYNMYLSNK